MLRDMDRRERILDAVMTSHELCRLEGAFLDYDRSEPVSVVYASTGSTGADWANELLDPI